MNEVFQRGGARIGDFLHASWPFCHIKVDKNLLELNASVIGKLVFRPGDIVSIDVVNGFFKGKGIRIKHRVPGYKSNLLFQMRTREDPNQLLDQIKATGFLDNQNPIPFDIEMTASEHQKQGMFPMKPAVAIGIVVIFNLLSLVNMDLLWKGKFGFSSPNPTTYSFGFMLLAIGAILFIPQVQKFALKPGRSVKDLRFFFIFVMLLFAFFFTLDLSITITNS